jgi:hypothetical protein
MSIAPSRALLLDPADLPLCPTNPTVQRDSWHNYNPGNQFAANSFCHPIRYLRNNFSSAPPACV